MDVTKLQKMNVLASTLKEHGLAVSREDAADIASDMVGIKDEEGFENVFAQPENEVPKAEHEAPKEEVNPVTMGETELKNILQSFADQFCGEINKINERLNSYEETLTKIQAADMNPGPESKAQIEPEPVEQVTLEPSKVQEQQESPRSGGFSSEDVSIDKFFYYGQK